METAGNAISNCTAATVDLVQDVFNSQPTSKHVAQAERQQILRHCRCNSRSISGGSTIRIPMNRGRVRLPFRGSGLRRRRSESRAGIRTSVFFKTETGGMLFVMLGLPRNEDH